ncbi:MAG: hypothetical protein QW189_00105 [Thermofilaceae archaeon]
MGGLVVEAEGGRGFWGTEGVEAEAPQGLRSGTAFPLRASRRFPVSRDGEGKWGEAAGGLLSPRGEGGEAAHRRVRPQFSTLPGYTEELKVSLSSIAEALEAFMLAGLVPGGVAEGLRSRDS